MAYVQASSFKSMICSVSQTRVDPNTYSCHLPHCHPHHAVTLTLAEQNWDLGLGTWDASKQELRTNTSALWGRRDGCKEECFSHRPPVGWW